nr:LacI family DNA-binding transcriptional regulator [uncultured Cohaesibacter sp.]
MGKNITIIDVAKLAGVSNGTVSRFFHEPHRVHQATRERIEKAIASLDYKPNALARNFRMGNTGAVMVLTSSIGDPFYGEILAGIGNEAKKTGHAVRIEEINEDSLTSEDLSAFFRSRQVDGIIIIGIMWPFVKSKQNGVTDEFAVVVCGETSDPELERYPRFQIDGTSAAKDLTSFLIHQGHSEIAFIGGAAAAYSMYERENGFRECMHNKGLPINENWVITTDLQYDSTRRAVQTLLAHGRLPSAVICATDDMALTAMSEFNRHEIYAPNDISITGFDDIRYSELSNPPLTTVAQPARGIGENAMQCLCSQMKGDRLINEDQQTSGVTYLPYKLVIRSSTAAI